ncbi:MAG: TldD/PmbA family protein [Acidobacteriota bacterium]
MKAFTALAMEAAVGEGASYADIRILRHTTEQITVTDGKIEVLDTGVDFGFGIRALIDGAWGFASSPDLNRDEVSRVAKFAAEVGRAAAGTKYSDVKLAPEPVHRDVTYETPCRVDPAEVPLKEKVDLLLEVSGVLMQPKLARTAQVSWGYERWHQVFANSEGSYITQTLTNAGSGYEVTAGENGVTATEQLRRLGWRGQGFAQGYEATDDLLEKARESARKVVEAVKQKASEEKEPLIDCPAGHYDMIAVFPFHEPFGHPLQTDRAIGDEMSFIGGSWFTFDQIGYYRAAADCVTVVADSVTPGLIGTYGYDDEGVQGQRVVLVENGILKNLITNREFAYKLGMPRSTGNMKAMGWARIPLVRMNNIYIEPGPWEYENLIADTERGIIMGGGVFQQTKNREKFLWKANTAWEIRNGKRYRRLRNVVWRGGPGDMLRACDALCKGDWTEGGHTVRCGGGAPHQNMLAYHWIPQGRYQGLHFSSEYF